MALHGRPYDHLTSANMPLKSCKHTSLGGRRKHPSHLRCTAGVKIGQGAPGSPCWPACFLQESKTRIVSVCRVGSPQYRTLPNLKSDRLSPSRMEYTAAP